MNNPIKLWKEYRRLQQYEKDVYRFFSAINDPNNPFLSPPYVEILQVANACLRVAKDIETIRPDIILASLREGYVIFRLSLGALRLALNIPVSDYNPIVVHPFLNDDNLGFTRDSVKTEEAKEELLSIVRRLGKFKRGMVVDRVTAGGQLANLFNNHSDSLESIAEQFYASVVSDTYGYPLFLEERIKNGQVMYHTGPRFSIFHEEGFHNPLIGLIYVGEGKNQVFPYYGDSGVQYEWKLLLSLIEGLYLDWRLFERTVSKLAFNK